jgi:hypothetical protein
MVFMTKLFFWGRTIPNQIVKADAHQENAPRNSCPFFIAEVGNAEKYKYGGDNAFNNSLRRMLHGW